MLIIFKWPTILVEYECVEQNILVKMLNRVMINGGVFSKDRSCQPTIIVPLGRHELQALRYANPSKTLAFGQMFLIIFIFIQNKICEHFNLIQIILYKFLVNFIIVLMTPY